MLPWCAASWPIPRRICEMPQMAENSGEKQGGRFQPGQSGNPAGKPKGARHRATMAIEEMLAGEAEALTRRCIDMALAGDQVAMRLAMERIATGRCRRSAAACRSVFLCLRSMP